MRKKSGLVLLDVIVGITALAIVAICGLPVYTYVQGSFQRARYADFALQKARDTLELLRAAEYGQIRTAYPQTTSAYPGNPSIIYTGTIQVRKESEPDGFEYKTISVTVSWTGPGIGNNQLSLDTVRSAPDLDPSFAGEGYVPDDIPPVML